MKPQIISILFFWKNDTPGGLGFTLTWPSGCMRSTPPMKSPTPTP